MSVSQFEDNFSITKTSSPSGAAEVVTLVHPATASKSARLVGMYIYSAVLTTFSLERAGVFTSSTAITIVNNNPANPNTTASQCSAGYGASVTTVNTINTWTIGITPPDGQYVDLTPFNIQMSGGIADNITVRTSSITGSLTIALFWREF
jgi:hypothetical protein